MMVGEKRWITLTQIQSRVGAVGLGFARERRAAIGRGPKPEQVIRQETSRVFDDGVTLTGVIPYVGLGFARERRAAIGRGPKPEQGIRQETSRVFDDGVTLTGV
ncbi:hypothetical protein L2E82_14879 [Cichorium intybus]|uniref:Uncharacterized protein n=1 Tax=Cichorium intybus TaxID=13427 RepID=A0ACB9F2H9_CICIN|nr:hypothetical protein L2E82_14879 [Cichorium intybus]